MRRLLKKDEEYGWGTEQEAAFTDLKEALCEPPVLKDFSDDPHLAVQVHTDASRLGLGGILLQEDEDGNLRPVIYLSRSLRPAEENYSSTELEALAVKWALDQLRPFLIGRKFQVVTDHHALCWVLRYKEGNQRLLRWSLTLQEYDFDVVHKSGASHRGPDCLSRIPPPAPEAKEAILSVSCDILQTTSVDFASSQQDDPFCKKYIGLLEGKVGTKKEQKRASKRYALFDAVLYRRDDLPLRQRFLLCLPAANRSEVLQKFHGGRCGGHMGIRRTFQRVRERYFWHKMFRDVKSFVQSCDLCQRMKVTPCAPFGLLQPVEVDTAFHTVGLDIVGPLQPSRRCRWIIVAIDYLTKFIEAKAVTNTEARTVQKFIERRIILKHGCPAVLITDRGTQMMAKSTEKYLEHRGIRHSPTTAYHPAGNGLVERANKTLKAMLRMLEAETGDRWPDILPYALFCYNTGYQDTVKQTPFYLVYGRDAVLPLDVVYTRRQLADLQETSDYTAIVRANLTEARRLAAKHIKLAQEKQKRLFDKRHRDIIFEKGQLVLMKSPPVGLKKKTVFEGPHRVLSRLSPVNYEIEYTDGRGTEVVHVEKLKPYVKPITDFQQT